MIQEFKEDCFHESSIIKTSPHLKQSHNQPCRNNTDIGECACETDVSMGNCCHSCTATSLTGNGERRLGDCKEDRGNSLNCTDNGERSWEEFNERNRRRQKCAEDRETSLKQLDCLGNGNSLVADSEALIMSSSERLNSKCDPDFEGEACKANPCVEGCKINASELFPREEDSYNSDSENSERGLSQPSVALSTTCKNFKPYN